MNVQLWAQIDSFEWGCTKVSLPTKVTIDVELIHIVSIIGRTMSLIRSWNILKVKYGPSYQSIVPFLNSRFFISREIQVSNRKIKLSIISTQICCNL